MAETKTAETKATPKKATATEKKAAPAVDPVKAAAAKLVNRKVVAATEDDDGKIVGRAVRAAPEHIFAARLDGDELVCVTVDGQRFRGPAPEALLTSAG